MQETEFENIFEMIENGKRELYTKNMIPGKKVYGEKLAHDESGIEYRYWSPSRSKLSACILNGMKENPITEGKSVLYLGASSGTTVSHVSDIVGEKGVVYAVEFSPRVGRNLLRLAEDRKNVIPIIGDVRRPQEYEYILGNIDIIYIDVAQPNQSELLIKNAESVLDNKSYFLFAIKSQSIDTTSDPELVYEREIQKLKDTGFEIIDKRQLSPYVKGHLMVTGTCNFGL